MAIMYDTLVEIDLEPVGTPRVLITADGSTEYALIKTATTKTFDIRDPADVVKISVELVDKKDHDPTTAVIVRDVRINGIASPKFAWAGVYYPIYPEPWASTQQNLAAKLPGQTYLGWNGRWELDITVPAFVWIHRTLGLGWVFE